MKNPESKKGTCSKRQLQVLELQVREYVERYHPELGDVAIDINPSGTLASVRKTRRTGRKA